MSENETPGIHVTVEDGEIKVVLEGDLSILSAATILRIAATNVEHSLGID